MIFSYVSLPEGIFVVSDKIAQFWGATSLTTPGHVTCDTEQNHLHTQLHCALMIGLGWGGVMFIFTCISCFTIYIYIIYIDTYIHMQGKVSDLEQVQKTTPAKPNRASA